MALRLVLMRNAPSLEGPRPLEPSCSKRAKATPEVSGMAIVYLCLFSRRSFALRRVPTPSPRWRGGGGKSRGARQLVKRHDALVARAGDEPRGIAPDGGALAARGIRGAPARIALDVRQELLRGPQPGLLLGARGAPVGAGEDRAGWGEGGGLAEGERGGVGGEGAPGGGERVRPAPPPRRNPGGRDPADRRVEKH